MNTGQLLQGAVRSIDKVRKVVYLSSDLETVSKCVVCPLCFSSEIHMLSMLVVSLS